MFDSLSDRLSTVFDRLRGRGALSEADVRGAMREVRIALLEADVALPVVRSFVDKVTEQAVGQQVLKSVTPGQQVVKIVHDALVDMLGADASARPRRHPARRHPDGRPAGLGQDHHHRPRSPSASARRAARRS
jgi:signal recognition particle GTPase